MPLRCARVEVRLDFHKCLLVPVVEQRAARGVFSAGREMAYVCRAVRESPVPGSGTVDPAAILGGMALIDIGEYRVWAEVSGTTGTAVVFIAGQGEAGCNWTAVLERMAQPATMVTYDRAGVGESDNAPESSIAKPYSWFVGELIHLLDALDLTQPMILVGHSFGALIARVFALRYPERVLGLVLAEASQPQLVLWDEGADDRRDGDTPTAVEIDTVRGAREVLPMASGIPAVVLTRTPGRWTSPWATAEIDAQWREMHASLARQLSAPHVIALDAGHSITREAPALVALAVDAVLRAVTTGMLALTPAEVQAAGGRFAN